MCHHKNRSHSFYTMNDIKKRLSRTLSGPRRCNKCQKMVYFSVYRCKQCGELTHKHCLYHTNQACKPGVSSDGEGNSLPPLIKPADYEGWRSPASPRVWWARKNRHMTDSPTSYDAEEAYQNELRHPSPGAAMAGLLKIVQWLSHRKRNRSNVAKTQEKHIKGKYGLNLNVEDKQTKKKLKTLIKNYQRQMYTTGYYGQHPQQRQQNQPQYLNSNGHSQQVRQRLINKRPSVVNESGSDIMSPRSSVSSYSGSSFMSPASTPDIDNVRGRRDKMTKQASIKWERDVIKSLKVANISPSNASNQPTDHQRSERTRFVSVSPKPSLRPNDTSWIPGDKNSIFNKRSALDAKITTVSFAPRPPGLCKAKTLSVESRECKNESLCATWPPAGKAGTILEEIVDEGEVDCIEETDESFNFSDFRTDSQNGEESLREWYIPYSDIEFQERLKHGREGDIYRGRWYGEVLIYTIREKDGKEKEMNEFLDEIAQMGMIRHENIVLFMGACIEPQKLAVITSMRKGPTLFEYLHLKRHRLPFHSKHNIARQIAQGMGYLHAKGIVHKKLNSKNIILECRVKLSIMDHGMSNKLLDRSDYGCISRGHLSYISPELMSSLQIDSPRIYTAKPCTQESDIFAFGSLLYELLAERFAFHDQPPHAVIYQVSIGKTAPLHNFRFINGLKELIKRCWSWKPEKRPPFSEIFQILQENISHHRRHSCSEPDLLHYNSQAAGRSLCT